MIDETTPIDAAVPSHPVSLTPSEITGLVGLFQNMLNEAEGRIVGQINRRFDENAKGATDRWSAHEKKHDDELKVNTARVIARFEKVEASDADTKAKLKALLDREHDEEVRMDARLRPIRGSVAWIWASRKDLVLILIGLGVFATFVVETFGRLLGPHAP